MDFSDPGLTFGIAIGAGTLAMVLARYLRIPGIVLLLVTGVVLGPDVAGLINPSALGHGLEELVGFAVAVILFEGGLNLQIGHLRGKAQVIRRLITIGAIITAVGGAVAAHWLMGWDWSLSIIFGTLITVTGPTVVNPIMRRIHLQPNLRTILEAEGVLIDPIGAIFAVVTLEVLLELTGAGGGSRAAEELLGLPYRLGMGLLIGVTGGLTIGFLLKRRRVVPQGLENILALALVLAGFQISNALIPESGILTVAIAGIVVGNMGIALHRDLLEFKEQLTTLLIGLLFVLLAADVRLADVLALGWPGVATVAALMFVVRPADVAFSTAGSELNGRERAFLAWLAPRGIVAFSVSSLFAERLTAAGFAGGVELGALVFLVIGVTVLIQGGLAAPVASVLGVRLEDDRGFVIVGANALARGLARALREALGERSEEILMIDSNAYEIDAARADGFRALRGHAGSEEVLAHAELELRRAFACATPNEGVNLLLAQKVVDEYRVRRAGVTLRHRDPSVIHEQVHEAGATVLFGRAIDFELWHHHFEQGSAIVSAWRYAGSGRSTLSPSNLDDATGESLPVLPLAYRRGSTALPVTDEAKIREGDEVWLAWIEASEDVAREWLLAGEWVPVPASDSDASDPEP